MVGIGGLFMKCPNCFKRIGNFFTYCHNCGFNIKKFNSDGNAMFEYALKLIKNGDYKESVLWLKNASKIGNSMAMYEYGRLFIDGLGVKKDNDSVIYCMKKSAELGNEDALLFLIDCYIYGKYGLSTNNKKGFELYQNLSDETKEKYSDLLVNIGYENEAEGEVYETSAIGEIIGNEGNLNTIEFNFISKNTQIENNPFDEEQSNLKKFYKKMDALLFKYSSNCETEEFVNFYDRDEWQNEMSKRKANIYYNNEINRINETIKKPYIGRMVIKFNEKEQQDIYVGEQLIEDVDRNIIVHSWFSELGNKIYDDINTSWFIKGKSINLKLKRNIIIENKKLLNVFETFNSLSGVTSNKIIADSYLLKIIEKKHYDGKISDIVSSIQHNQNQIITSDFNHNMIMQGCAGCGKTMILFHRIKYMLGNNIRDSRSICIITPSENFNSFIQPLLDDLNIRSINVYSVSSYYINVLDNYQSDNRWKTLFREGNSIGSKPLIIEDDSTLPNNVVEYYYSSEFFEKVNSLEKVTIKSIIKSEFNTLNKKDNNGYIDIINALLGRNEKMLLPKYERRMGVIHKCELYALCLFYFKRCGKYKYQKENYVSTEIYPKFSFKFDLMMIDEAQDISLFEYKLINSLGDGNPVFNLFGDVKQMISNFGIASWDNLISNLGNFDIYEYNKNYRNSSEIIDFVNKECKTQMENIGYESFQVINLRKFELLDKFTNDLSVRKAIICSIKNKQNYLDNYPLIASNVYSTIEVKGMEFDSVYVEPDDMSNNEKYIALTRALIKLVILI